MMVKLSMSRFVAALVVHVLLLMAAAAVSLAWIVFVAAAVAGVGYAGLQLIPLSMLPDATAAA